MLPVRVVPLPEESIDSWLEAMCRNMDLSQKQMFEILGISRSRRQAFIERPTPTELQALTESTGLAAMALLGMTLSRYDGTAIAIDDLTGRRTLNFPFGMRAGSRFCPQCLQETRGRWQLRWRLGWAFVCTRHLCLLADACPTCEHVLRDRDARILSALPGHCRCGTDLSATLVHRLSPSDEIVAAQQTVYKVIDDGGTRFGVYADTAGTQTARSALADTAILASRVNNYACEHGFKRIATALRHGADLPSELFDAHPPKLRFSLWGRAPARSFDTAIGVTLAMQILGSPDLDTAATRAAWLYQRSSRWPGPSAFLRNWRGSAVLKEIVIKAHAPRMGPTDQLRWRTAIPGSCAPSRDSAEMKKLATTMPASFWPLWAISIPRVGEPSRQAQSCALAVATLLVGTAADPADVVRALGGCISEYAARQTIERAARSPHWSAICAAISRLNRHLRMHGSPIDYERRRGLDYSTLLPEHRWKSLCRQADEPVGAGRRWIEARHYLIKKLSGNPIQARDMAPFTDRPDTWARAVNDFQCTVARDFGEVLELEARKFLFDNAIEEPITWSPTLSLIADLEIPAPDLGAIDIPEMHQLVIEKSYTCGQLARHFGLDPPTIRYLFEQHPLEVNRFWRQRGRPDIKAFAQLRKRLNAATLRELYIDERLPVKLIMERFGATRRQVRELRFEYQIPTRSR